LPAHSLRLGIFGLCTTALCVSVACAQVSASPQAAEKRTEPPTTEQPGAPAESSQTSSPEKRSEWLIAPLPVVDPTIKNGVALVGGYLTPVSAKDKVSPPSVFGGAGLRTSNGTWAVAGATSLYLKQDRFRVLVAGGTARLNYNFYGIGNESGQGTGIPIFQNGGGLLAGVLIRTIERWYVGSRYYYFRVKTGIAPDATETADAVTEVGFRMPVAALAFHIARDTRDSQFYPRSGSVFDAKGYFSDKSVGSLFRYQDYEVSFQQYFPLGSKQVLAYRAKACAVNGNAPFFALCSLGNSADMRGYPAGRYRDNRMLVGQAEYRRELWKRLGAAAFFGAGQVAPSFSNFKGSSIRPGGGAGLRFLLAPKNRINLRVDYSLGQGSHAWYVGVGEAF
jgi:hypothetical protein